MFVLNFLCLEGIICLFVFFFFLFAYVCTGVLVCVTGDELVAIT